MLPRSWNNFTTNRIQSILRFHADTHFINTYNCEELTPSLEIASTSLLFCCPVEKILQLRIGFNSKEFIREKVMFSI